MLVHGKCPTSMLIGTMIAIPKVKRQVVCDSNNFRAKCFKQYYWQSFRLDYFNEEEKLLCSSELQFGFKQGVSTTHGTHVVNKTINYYNFNKINVHLLLLDGIKAFDQVKYCKLFQEILNHNVSPMVLRLLSVMHINQTLHVKWKSKISDGFSV